MNVVVLDLYDKPRDMAQMDMYKALQKAHNIYLATPTNIFSILINNKVDVLWLGIYHHRISIDWKMIYNIVNLKRIKVIIDNADNEEFIKEWPVISYSNFQRKVLTSRYLPHSSMEILGKKLGCNVKQLSWYVDPQRVIKKQDKIIDIAFICDSNPRRIKWKEELKKRGIKFFDVPCFGDIYYTILSMSKVFVIECERACLTQKYVEAALNDCSIYGDSVERPFKYTFPGILEELKPYDISGFRHLAMQNFANQDILIEQFKKVLA